MTPTSLTADLLALAAAHDAEYHADDSLIITHGEGALITDSDGHVLIDLSDIAANVGHCHPRHVAAIQAAAAEMITGKSGMLNPPRARLVARLAALTPPNLDKVYLVSGGSEAIDWAIRIARRATGRHEILSFWGGIYGRTYAASSLNGLQRRRRQMGPVMPGVVHAPFPHCYRCPFGKQPEDCNFFCIDFLDEVLDHASTGDVAALIIEPYLGVGGIVYPPEGYLTRLQAWARERGILFILDEVQASFGRTGKLFALDWEGLTPDILVVGKGLGSGVALAALLASGDLFDRMAPGEMSGGNGGTYLACASALAVLDILRDEALPEHALQIGRLSAGALPARGRPNSRPSGTCAGAACAWPWSSSRTVRPGSPTGRSSNTSASTAWRTASMPAAAATFWIFVRRW